MDIPCTNCGEPWDTDHLRHDEIWECEELTDEEKKNFSGVLTDRIRHGFRSEGWKFGPSLYAIHQCPACPKDARGVVKKRRGGNDRMEAVDAVAGLLGDDLDGMAAMMEDFDL